MTFAVRLTARGSRYCRHPTIGNISCVATFSGMRRVAYCRRYRLPNSSWSNGGNPTRFEHCSLTVVLEQQEVRNGSGARFGADPGNDSTTSSFEQDAGIDGVGADSIPAAPGRCSGCTASATGSPASLTEPTDRCRAGNFFLTVRQRRLARAAAAALAPSRCRATPPAAGSSVTSWPLGRSLPASAIPSICPSRHPKPPPSVRPPRR